MTDEELEELKERCRHYRNYEPGDAVTYAMRDITTLIAEIDRLRAELKTKKIVITTDPIIF